MRLDSKHKPRAVLAFIGTVLPITKGTVMKNKIVGVGDKINVRTNKGILLAVVVKDNPQRWWVRLPDGNVVKRHKVKHAA